MKNQKIASISEQKSIWKNDKPIYLLLFTVSIASLSAIPIIFDSFTTPKMATAFIGVSIVSFALLRNVAYKLNALGRLEILLLMLYIFAMSVATYVSDIPFERAFLGQFGRGNGYGYYFLTILIFIATFSFWKKSNDHFISFVLQKFSWVISIYAILQSWGIDFAQIDTTKSRILLTLGNSNFSGGLLSIFFTYNIILIAKSKSYKVDQILLVSTLFYATVITGAVQGIIIALSAVLISLNIAVKNYSLKTFRRFKYLQIIGSLLIVMLMFFGRGPLQLLLNRPTLRIRFEYWKIGLKMLQDNLYFGVGPDAFYDYSSEYMAPGTIEVITYTRIDAAHNWFINLGANFGILTLIPILLLFSLITIKSFQFISSKEVTPQFMASFIAFLMLLLDALFSIEQPGLGIWLYFFAGLTLAMIPKKFENENSHVEQNILTRNILLTGILIASLLSSSFYLYRINHDLQLRSQIRNFMVGNLDSQIGPDIVASSLKLQAEPEYANEAIKVLAKMGNASGLDNVSKAVYDYNTNSIQSLLIRQEILRVLNRSNEACPIVEKLVERIPWDLSIWEAFLLCQKELNKNDFNGELAKLTLPFILLKIETINQELPYFVSYLILASINYHLLGKNSVSIEYFERAMKLNEQHSVNASEDFVLETKDLFNVQAQLLFSKFQMHLSKIG